MIMSTAIQYHEATKYHPETVGNHPGLDWAKMPVPFKVWDTEAAVALAPYLPFDPNPFTGEAAGPEAVISDGLGLVSRWIYHTCGITALVPQEPRPLFLRANPSAGGLYPAEIHLIAHGYAGLEDGLYGYDLQGHRLVPLWSGADIHAGLVEACYGNAAVAAAPLSLVVTGVFERSRWRYQERAYRRILLDAGHLIGNAGLAAHALGGRTHATTAFADEAIETVLRLDPDTEGALAVVSWSPGQGVSERPNWTALPSPTGPAQVDPPLLDALHRQSRLPRQRPALVARGETQELALEQRYGWSGGTALRAIAVPATSLAAPATGVAPALSGLAGDPLGLIRTRRSARSFTGKSCSLAQLAEVLLAAIDPVEAGLGRQPAFDRSQLMTFVAVNAVDGLAPGVYYLAPDTFALRLVRTVVQEQMQAGVRFLCLGQDLGGDAAFVVVHTADLAAAVRANGDRAYRLLHLDAGIIGQRLDLAAIGTGLGASGIGGFFDDHITDQLGVPREQAVVYLTCVGVPG